MNAQLQYRRNDNEQINVFPTLGGTDDELEPRGAGLAEHRHRRTMHNVNVNCLAHLVDARSTATRTSRTSPATPGITGVSTDPFDWGVPALSFSSLSSLRDVDAVAAHRSTR